MNVSTTIEWMYSQVFIHILKYMHSHIEQIHLFNVSVHNNRMDVLTRIYPYTQMHLFVYVFECCIRFFFLMMQGPSINVFVECMCPMTRWTHTSHKCTYLCRGVQWHGHNTGHNTELPEIGSCAVVQTNIRKTVMLAIWRPQGLAAHIRDMIIRTLWHTLSPMFTCVTRWFVGMETKSGGSVT